MWRFLSVRSPFFFLILIVLSVPPFAAKLPAQEVVSVRVQIDAEPMWAAALGLPYPLDGQRVVAAAREEARRVFSAMIYGWSFEWIPGNTLRGIDEELILDPFGEVDGADGRLRLVSTEHKGSRFAFFVEYTPTEHERRRYDAWQSAGFANVHGSGALALSSSQDAKWLALEDAARSAVAALVQSRERTRPRRVFGSLALESPPRIWIAGGQWRVQARFRVAIEDIEAYLLW